MATDYDKTTPSAQTSLIIRFAQGAVANARRLQATASFFTPFLSLSLKAILNRSESSGFYRVGIVFGYA